MSIQITALRKSKERTVCWERITWVSIGEAEENKGDGPRMIVARPRAVPIPLPLMAFGPTRLNLRQTFSKSEEGDIRYGHEHRRILQHIRDDEESNHASTDVHLVQLRDASIASSHRDIPQGYVQVIFRWVSQEPDSVNAAPEKPQMRRTFRELPAIELAGFELDGDDVSQRFVEELDGDPEAGTHFVFWGEGVGG